MNIKRYILGFSALFLSIMPFSAHAANEKVYWSDGYGKVYYNVNSNPSPVVKVALGMFANDMKAVVGYAAKEKANANIQVYQLDQLNNKEFAALEKLGTPIHQFITKSDAFWIGTRQGKVIVVGSDARGTAYGIMELSRMAGVSPWKDYLHLLPLQRKVLSTPIGYESLQIPSVHYRGLLLNDSEWMKSKDNSRLCRLMLRLRANVLWQGDSKHEMSYNKEATDSFDILVGEDGKVTELLGKKHKKHKKNIEDVKILWENAQISFASMSPALICSELTKSNTPTLHKGKGHKSHNAHADGTEAWIANVVNPQASNFNLSLFMDLAWNPQSIGTNGVESYLSRWINSQFGDNLGRKILPIIKEYYRLTNIRPTAYMAMPYGDWEFHSGEFGNELEQYLYDFDQLKAQTDLLERSIPTTLKTTYRQSIKLPVYIAALTAEKELEAQEARHIARPGLFQKDDEAKAAAALSLTAYQKLKAILPSAAAPALPGTLSNTEIKESLKDAFDRTEDLKPLTYSQTKDIIAKNAYQWTSTSLGDNKHSNGAITLLPYLGHSMKAVALPQGASLNYVVNTEVEGDARFTIASIPNYQDFKGDMRVSVSIDHAEPVVISLKDNYNHSDWKMDVWRGQIRKSFFTTLSKGNHSIEIKALDDNIILDQWALDFDVDREYYIIPTRQ